MGYQDVGGGVVSWPPPPSPPTLPAYFYSVFTTQATPHCPWEACCLSLLVRSWERGAPPFPAVVPAKQGLCLFHVCCPSEFLRSGVSYSVEAYLMKKMAG